MKKFLALAFALILVLTTLTACGGSSDGTKEAGGTTWPSKGAVTVTVPYSAGGDTDTYCRALFKLVGEDLKQNFVVVNTTGGSGVAASTAVKDAKNDGYTLLFHHSGVMLTQKAVGSNTFSFLNDFEVCATAARDDTYMLIVKKDAAYKTLAEFIDYCKAHPKEVKYSITFNGATHAVATLMEQTMGIEMNKIDVGSSAADRLTAFMANQCDCLVINYMNVKDYIEKGDFIVLGVCANERPEGMKDFPTMKEQGYDVVQSKLYEIRFPKGTDAAIVEKLSAAIEKAAKSPAFAETLAKYFAQPYYRNGADTVKEDAAEVEQLKKLFQSK